MSKCRKRLSAYRHAICIAFLAMFSVHANGHDVRPAYLGITETKSDVFDVVWKQARRNGRRMGLDPIFPDGCTRATDIREQLVAGAVILSWQVHCREAALQDSPVIIHGLTNTLIDVWADVQRLHHNASFSTQLTASEPQLWLENPGDNNLADYVTLGFRHLLSGADHILLIVGLMFFARGFLPLLKTLTAFTVAHSVSLGASTLGWIQLSAQPVEAAISLSLLFLAYEASRPANTSTLSARAPWRIAFVCGLLHGLGFAGGLQQVGLPPGRIAEALLLFNIGIEFGQLFLVAAILIIGKMVCRLPFAWPGWLSQAPVYTIGGLASLWILQFIALGAT